MRRVVITGIGALTPIGNTYASYVEGLKNGVSGAGPITRFDASQFKVKFACELKNFDVEQFIPKKDARRLDPFAQYALIVADEAIQMSGLDLSLLDLDRSGVVWGTGIGGFETIEHDISEAALWTGEPRYSPFLIPKLIGDIAPGH
ncbi:MAG TPA: beta-ketoacyl synthase N-terminal-like domain-containing protein, partial [Saprospiraceae bacterium]|nr:beta-ketoacyl synthase N-terminal-like domain-containing protein [Saprospiraceae bacterium]